MLALLTVHSVAVHRAGFQLLSTTSARIVIGLAAATAIMPKFKSTGTYQYQ